MSDLRALIERLEKLDGPSREVDALLHAMAEGRTVRENIHPEFGRQLLARNNRPPHDEYWLDHPANVFPAYTASVDAAIALCERVLPGWEIEIICQGGGWHAGVGRDICYTPGCANGLQEGRPTKYPATALVLATIRAKAQEGRNDG